MVYHDAGERDVEDGDFGDEVRHRAGRRHRQVHRAELRAFDRFTLSAQRAGVEVLHFVTAAGALLDFPGERVDGDAVMRILRNRDIHLQRLLRQRRQRKDCGCDCDNS